MIGFGRALLRFPRVVVCALVLGAQGLAVQGLAAQEVSAAQQLIQTVQDDPDNRAARWALAQLAFQGKNYDAARYHVQVLLQSSRSQNDIDTLTQALARITAADPWDVDLNFAVLPSTNIRRTTFNTQFETALGVFTPTGGGEAESGIGVTAGAGLSYALSLPDASRLTLRARVDQYLYQSSDLNLTGVVFAVRRDSYAVGSNTTLEPFVRLRYGDTQRLERRDLGISLSRGWQRDDRLRITAAATLEQRDDLLNAAASGPYGRVRLGYGFDLDERTQMTLGLSVARSDPQRAHLTYWEGEVSASATRRFDDIGALGLFAQVRARHYGDIFPATSVVREDERIVLGVTVQPSGFDMFGARPNLRCQVERNASTIALYDYNATECRLTFDRRF